ncbi:hypothetical protein COCSUDRAFT_62919 [Coccomyxa subellipsoidea C-169]|uniref:Uncharacterized protein n=1 Tax=Coccomyxa subellipsoidea (strain C-169) TaxID=574566 RepID=I0YYB4_COCSC|nr:hypothetical protein COCSUDRAFT_62919 [Coccomyxa subellipsoidea C-169]EIE23383.1 hypothetical protein COCSUDRAFT_62919 [Coccomyxa subellipsoidea C-169]|eukprot:XP_005647927.1 hypothetical protein COCSUDRAFT_62919 [Coccomyxa subellipsoidea C-169]
MSKFKAADTGLLTAHAQENDFAMGDVRQSSSGASCSYDPRDPKQEFRWGAGGSSSPFSSSPFSSRDAQRQQERIRQAVQQQLQQRPAWQTLLVPAASLGLLTLLFGPILFGLLTAGLAIGAAITFSAASLFFIFPLIAGAFMLGGLGFGLSAGAFVLSGIVASVFNLALVGAGLAAGWALTNTLIRSALPGSAGPNTRGAAGRPAAGRSREVEIDVEAEKRDAAAREEKEASAAAAEELRRFDALLAERERLRQIEQGVRWKP